MRAVVGYFVAVFVVAASLPCLECRSVWLVALELLELKAVVEGGFELEVVELKLEVVVEVQFELAAVE